MKKLIEINQNTESQIQPVGIDLSDSFILGWARSESEFQINLELSIWSDSPYYSKPLNNEYTCYKKGCLRFYGIKEILGFIELESVKSTVDPDDSRDWGGIYEFKKINKWFKFSTDFTDIEIECKGFDLELFE